MATTRKRLHELLDALPEDRLDDLEAAISAITEPPYRPLDDAPGDDEPTTADDLADAAETRAELARGETVPGDAVRREFGW